MPTLWRADLLSLLRVTIFSPLSFIFRKWRLPRKFKFCTSFRPLRLKKRRRWQQARLTVMKEAIALSKLLF
jgi:hypothetical protein